MQKKALLLKRLKKFVSCIEPGERIAILYHKDPDGLCAAVIAASALEKSIGRLKFFPTYYTYGDKPVLSGQAVSMLRKQKCSRLVVLDLHVLDDSGKALKKAEKFFHILVIDHHKGSLDLNSKKTVFIKPQLFSKIDSGRYPASKLCFDFFSELADIRSLKWVAAVGTVADFGYTPWKKFVDSSLKEHGFKVTSEWHKNRFALIDKKIGAVSALHEKYFKLLLNEMKNSSGPKDFLKSRLLRKGEAFEREYSYWFKNQRRLAEFYPEKNLVFYFIKPNYKIKSKLVNDLSYYFYPEKIVVIAQDIGTDSIYVSMRCQTGGTDVANLLESSLKGLKHFAGGHKQSSGGNFKKKDFKKFKKRLMELL